MGREATVSEAPVSEVSDWEATDIQYRERLAPTSEKSEIIEEKLNSGIVVTNWEDEKTAGRSREIDSDWTNYRNKPRDDVEDHLRYLALEVQRLLHVELLLLVLILQLLQAHLARILEFLARLQELGGIELLAECPLEVLLLLHKYSSSNLSKNNQKSECLTPSMVWVRWRREFL